LSVFWESLFIPFHGFFTGVEVSPAEIKSSVSSVIDINKDILLEERYRVNGKNIYDQIMYCVWL
jgi:hypothetical protein